MPNSGAKRLSKSHPLITFFAYFIAFISVHPVTVD
jgi:hypothetical protein